MLSLLYLCFFKWEHPFLIFFLRFVVQAGISPCFVSLIKWTLLRMHTQCVGIGGIPFLWLDNFRNLGWRLVGLWVALETWKSVSPPVFLYSGGVFAFVSLRNIVVLQEEVYFLQGLHSTSHSNIHYPQWEKSHLPSNWDLLFSNTT